MIVQRERGSATVLGIGVILVLFTLVVSVLVLGAVVTASNQARTAADLAALAGAGELRLGAGRAQVCQVAAQVASDNHANLADCHVESGQTGVRAGPLTEPQSGPWVLVRAEVAVPALGGVPAGARARAGLVPADR